jgi:hypothetical protein
VEIQFAGGRLRVNAERRSAAATSAAGSEFPERKGLARERGLKTRSISIRAPVVSPADRFAGRRVERIADQSVLN